MLFLNKQLKRKSKKQKPMFSILSRVNILRFMPEIITAHKVIKKISEFLKFEEYNPTYHGTLMGHLGTKNGNLSQQSATPETTQRIDFSVIIC